MDVLHEEIIEAARRLGVSANVAVDMAMSVESGLRSRCGGGEWYVQVDDKSARNSFIFVAYSSGESVKSIAAREGLSAKAIYKILEYFKVSQET